MFSYFASAEEIKVEQPDFHLSDVNTTASGRTVMESSFKDISTNPSSSQTRAELEDSEELGSNTGSYMASAIGILIDEKIDYTVDGINYALEALGEGIVSLGEYAGLDVKCGYVAEKEE